MPNTPPEDRPTQSTSEIEPDVEGSTDDDDADSAYGAPSVNSATTSVTSSIMKYRMENGRRYHAYKEGKYVLPNDEDENERLGGFSLGIDTKNEKYSDDLT